MRRAHTSPKELRDRLRYAAFAADAAAALADDPDGDPDGALSARAKRSAAQAATTTALSSVPT